MTRSLAPHLAALLALAAGPALAQPLEPRLAFALELMTRQAAALCHVGSAPACQRAQQLGRLATQLAQADFDCRAGSQKACLFQQAGAEQVAAAWQQAQAQPSVGPDYAPWQMQWEHQQRMLLQQQQFAQHQWMMRQQQRLFDQQNRRFLEQLRR